MRMESWWKSEFWRRNADAGHNLRKSVRRHVWVHEHGAVRQSRLLDIYLRLPIFWFTCSSCNTITIASISFSPDIKGVVQQTQKLICAREYCRSPLAEPCIYLAQAKLELI